MPTVPNEKQASSLRRYFVEYVVLGLCVAVVTLFGMYYNLNRFITTTILDDKARESTIIEKNTEALQMIYFLHPQKENKDEK